MIDARNIYRKVTRKIYDFSPEQEQNLLAIVWLYRGQTDRYLDLVSSYCRRTLDEAAACFDGGNSDATKPLPEFVSAFKAIADAIPLQKTLSGEASDENERNELIKAKSAFLADVDAFQKEIATQQEAWKKQRTDNGELKKAVDRLAPLAEASRNLIKQADLVYKLASRVIENEKNEGDPASRMGRGGRDITRSIKAADEARQQAALQLKQVRYFWKQARWLTDRFPEASLCDVEGLVRLASIDDIRANDWSLTPGRYVGVAPEEEDENFDFEEALREIHVELEDLNAEAVRLAAVIKRNFEELGI